MNENEWLISLCESDAARFWTTAVAELTEPERTFVSIWTLEADAHDAPRALRAVGADAMAAIVEEANAVFGGDGPPADRDARQRAQDALGAEARERWSALDDRFYEYPDDLTGLLYAYVQANRAQIQGVA